MEEIVKCSICGHEGKEEELQRCAICGEWNCGEDDCCNYDDPQEDIVCIECPY